MRATRATALQAVGRSKGKLYRLNPPAETLLDDAGLAHKVESVLFRNPNVPKGKISVNAESGTVYLRGQLENADLIDAVVESARAIPGVGEVVSLLHLPGTEAPHPPPAHRPAHTGS
jgi:osmotically-inducible protein OsmY